MNNAPFTSEQGIKLHLIDSLKYEDQFNDYIKNKDQHEHHLVDYQDYERPRLIPGLTHPDQIAIIYGDGAIQRGEGGFDPILSPGGSAMGSDEMVKALTTAREDDDVRAVVLRINSPGGDVIASELIRRQVELTAGLKPVVVSMSGYAASGGYWIATPAGKIFAESGTITGSIGVLGGKFNVSAMMQKLGINSGDISRGANATMFDAFTDFTPSQQKIFNDQILGDTYQHFLQIVAKSRHMPVAQVNKIGQGHVWTGEQAVKLKLVDKLGGLDDALNEAKRLARLSPNQPVKLLELPEQPGLLTQLLGGGLASRVSSGPSAGLLKPVVRALHTVLARRAAAGQAYCPWFPVM